MIAVGRTRRCVNKAFDPGIASSDQHIEETIDICSIGHLRVGQRTGDRAQCGLMEHVVDVLAHTATVFCTTDIAFDKVEPEPLRRRNRVSNLVQIPLIPRRKIIQPDNFLIEFKQSLDEMRAYESGAAGHQPAGRLGFQAKGELIKGRQSRHTVTPFALSCSSSNMLFTSVSTPPSFSFAVKSPSGR